MAGEDTPVYFNRAGATRIRKAVQVVERGLRNGPPVRGRFPLVDGAPGVQLAKTQSGGISGMSGSSVGFGNVELYDVNADKTTTATGIVIEVIQIGGAIPADKWVNIADGPRGPWVVVYPCTT